MSREIYFIRFDGMITVMTNPEVIRGHTSVERVDELVIPFTYSSRLEGNRPVPSRLSQLAFDAAVLYYQDIELAGRQPLLMVASEQSYSTHPETTGQLLEKGLREDGSHVRSLVLVNERNRLLNTVLQAEEIAKYTNESYTETMTTVAWDFHIKRINMVYRSLGVQSRFVGVEEVLDKTWEQSTDYRQAFHDRYGLTMTWPEARERVQRGFMFREWYTRQAQRVAGGALLNWVSHHTGSGRYDDITPDGSIIREKTW